MRLQELANKPVTYIHSIEEKIFLIESYIEAKKSVKVTIKVPHSRDVAELFKMEHAFEMACKYIRTNYAS